MPRYAVSLAYLGSAFGGWDNGSDDAHTQRPSALAVLRAAMQRLGETGQIEGACRLDAGVHAAGQCAHLDCRRSWAPQHLATALDHQLPPQMACHAAACVSDDWHAALTASAKTYRYHIDRSSPRDPQLVARSWRPPGPLNRRALHNGARLLASGGDLTGFLRRKDHRKHIATVLHSIRWCCRDPLWACTITGDRFTYRLVRSLIAAMVRCAGTAAICSDLATVLRGETHPLSTHCAPAHGLELVSVHYPDAPQWELAAG